MILLTETPFSNASLTKHAMMQQVPLHTDLTSL